MHPLARTGAIVCLSLVSLVLALRAVGASWVNVAFAVVPLAVAFVLVALEPRLHWLTRPKPKLTFAVKGANDRYLAQGGLPPWPLQVDRIVDNEALEALGTIRDRETLPSWLLTGGVGFTSRPTPEDHERAKEKFKSTVDTYREDLSEWLATYAAAALARWQTFEVSLELSNAVGAVHAEAVEVVLDLPGSVSRGTAEHQVDPPPARPTYSPPAPQPVVPYHVTAWNRPSPVVAGPRLDWAIKDAVSFRPAHKDWDESAGGRRLTAPKVEVQPGRTVEVAESLWLRADSPGDHEIGWTIYSQSLDHPVRGSFKLVVPEGDPDRPPFGRIEGILRYPDVPIAREDDEGEATDEDDEPLQPTLRPVRVCDPPLSPPDSSAEEDGDVGAKLRAASERWRWEALGLDPAFDGPSSSRVEVHQARLHDRES